MKDPTPAMRTVTRPYDDGALKQVGSWQRTRNEKAYGNDFVVSSDRGDALTRKVRRASSIALVAVTARNAGTVKVFIGREKVATVSLKGRKDFNVVRIVGLDGLQSGQLRVVVGKDKSVTLEGLAIVTDRRGA